MIAISTAKPGDIQDIRQVAEEVWWPTYSAILEQEQIAYMLKLFYSEEVILNQIETGAQTYILLEDEGIITGFAAYSPRTEDTRTYKLHKLYCNTQQQGKGYGRLLLEAVERNASLQGATRLELNVNRYNAAKSFYEKMGYTIAYEEDIDIGNGYWMNDYVMGKNLQ